MIRGRYVDTQTVELISLGGIAELWQMPRATVYSKYRRGQLPVPDWVVAIPAGATLEDGVPVWLAERFTDDPEQTNAEPAEDLPRLVGMDELAVIMHVKRTTVETMRSRGRQDIAAPEPYTHLGKSPVWWADPWERFAKQTGRTWDMRALVRLDKERRKQSNK